MKTSTIIRLITLCLLVQIFISFQLWMPIFRGVPEIPAFSWLPIDISNNFRGWLFGALLIGLLLLLIIPKNRWLSLITVVTLIIFCLQDVLCLQPWVFLYGLFIIINALTKSQEEKLKLFKLLLIGLYVWSGIQKLNVNFAYEMLPFLLKPFGLNQLVSHNPAIGWVFASIELIAGLLLAFNKTRRKAMLTLVTMHLFILISIGPWGQNWNQVVWPWNITQILLLWLLFSKSDTGYVAVTPKYMSIKILLIVLVFIMPVFNLSGKWDHYLSSSLYSGNTPVAFFYYGDEDKHNIKRFNFSKDSKAEILDLWVLDRTNAAMYPETRYYKYLGKCLCEKLEHPENAGIDILYKPRFNHINIFVRYKCSDLIDR